MWYFKKCKLFCPTKWRAHKFSGFLPAVEVWATHGLSVRELHTECSHSGSNWNFSSGKSSNEETLQPEQGRWVHSNLRITETSCLHDESGWDLSSCFSLWLLLTEFYTDLKMCSLDLWLTDLKFGFAGWEEWAGLLSKETWKFWKFFMLTWVPSCCLWPKSSLTWRSY